MRSKVCLDKREVPPGKFGDKVGAGEGAEETAKGNTEGEESLGGGLLHLYVEDKHDSSEIDAAEVEDGISKVEA